VDPPADPAEPDAGTHPDRERSDADLAPFDDVPDASSCDGGTASHPDAAPAPDPDGELLQKLSDFKFKARREVVWARSTIANIPSYEDALRRYDREAQEWQMAALIPDAPDADAARKEIEALCASLGISILSLTFKEEPLERRPLPETIHGDKPFAFEDNDIRGMLQVVLVTGPLPEGTAAKFAAGANEMQRLVRVLRIRSEKERGLINLQIYYFLSITVPRHIVVEKDLNQELARMGITQPLEEVVRKDVVGHLQNAAMSYKEYNQSLPELNRAMELLSQTRYKGARSEFFRRTFEQARKAPLDPMAPK
jgi:hypothetical protein